MSTSGLEEKDNPRVTIIIGLPITDGHPL